jgi:hypothetical protein
MWYLGIVFVIGASLCMLAAVTGSTMLQNSTKFRVMERWLGYQNARGIYFVWAFIALIFGIVLISQNKP